MSTLLPKLRIITIFLLLLPVVIACTKTEVIEEELPPPVTPAQPPKPALHSFKVMVMDVTYNSARIEWEPAVDFHLDSIVYSIRLDSQIVASDLRGNREFQFSNLVRDHLYSVEVKARNAKGDSVVSKLSFKTDDGYLKFAKLVSPDLIAEDMAVASNRGYVIIADTTFNNRLKILRIDSLGNVLWRKGFNLDARSSRIKNTNDGYLVMGYHYIMKIDSSGNLIWQTLMPSTGVSFFSFTESATGEIYITGATDIIGEGLRQAAIYKLDNRGGVIWEKKYPANLYDQAKDILPAPDGNSFYVVGEKENMGKTWEEYVYGGGAPTDMYIEKIDADGNILWQKTYGDVRYDYAQRLCFIGNDLMVGGWVQEPGTGTAYQLLRFDQNGNLKNNVPVKPLAFLDRFRSIEPTSDGGYIVVGTYGLGLYTRYIGVFKFSATNQKEWEKTFEFGSTAAAVKQTWDGGYSVIATGSGVILLRLNPSGDFE